MLSKEAGSLEDFLRIFVAVRNLDFPSGCRISAEALCVSERAAVLRPDSCCYCLQFMDVFLR